MITNLQQKRRRRFAGIAAILTWMSLGCASLQAQTIEQVLRGLEERYNAVEHRSVAAHQLAVEMATAYAALAPGMVIPDRPPLDSSEATWATWQIGFSRASQKMYFFNELRGFSNALGWINPRWVKTSNGQLAANTPSIVMYRQMVAENPGLLAYTPQAIGWPYPLNADLPLDRALANLNHASRIFSLIKGIYVDQAPDIGAFTPSNYRDKLPIFARALSRLKALPWPLAVSACDFSKDFSGGSLILRTGGPAEASRLHLEPYIGFGGYESNNGYNDYTYGWFPHYLRSDRIALDAHSTISSSKGGLQDIPGTTLSCTLDRITTRATVSGTYVRSARTSAGEDADPYLPQRSPGEYTEIDRRTRGGEGDLLWDERVHHEYTSEHQGDTFYSVLSYPSIKEDPFMVSLPGSFPDAGTSSVRISIDQRVICYPDFDHTFGHDQFPGLANRAAPGMAPGEVAAAYVPNWGFGLVIGLGRGLNGFGNEGYLMIPVDSFGYPCSLAEWRFEGDISEFQTSHAYDSKYFRDKFKKFSFRSDYGRKSLRSIRGRDCQLTIDSKGPLEHVLTFRTRSNVLIDRVTIIDPEQAAALGKDRSPETAYHRSNSSTAAPKFVPLECRGLNWTIKIINCSSNSLPVIVTRETSSRELERFEFYDYGEINEVPHQRRLNYTRDRIAMNSVEWGGAPGTEWFEGIGQGYVPPILKITDLQAGKTRTRTAVYGNRLHPFDPARNLAKLTQISLQGVGWADAGDVINFGPNDEPISWNERFGSLEIGVQQSISGNLLTTQRSVGNTPLQATNIDFSNGLTKVTSSTGSGTESTVQFDPSNSWMTWLPVASRAPFAVRQSIATSPKNGGYEVVISSGTGRGALIADVEAGSKATHVYSAAGDWVGTTVVSIPGEVVLESLQASGHQENVWRSPQSVTSQLDGGRWMQTFFPDGQLASHTGVTGEKLDGLSYDPIDRLRSGSVEGAGFNLNYSGLSTTGRVNGVAFRSVSDLFGAESTQNSNSPLSSSITSSKTIAGPDESIVNWTQDGRPGSAVAFPDGLPKSTAASHGLPGEVYTYGVESVPEHGNCLFIAASAPASTIALRKTYFDGAGRVVKIDTPAPGGTGIVSTSVVYKASEGKVFIDKPGDGPDIEVHRDPSTGNTTTSRVKGNVRQAIAESTVAIEGARIVSKEKLRSDAEGGGFESTVAVEPTARRVTFTGPSPSQNLTISTTGTPVAGTVVAAGPQISQTTNLAKGRVSDTTILAGGATTKTTVYRDPKNPDRITALETNSPDGLTRVNFGANGKLSSVSSPGGNISVSHETPSGGGYRISTQDTAKENSASTEIRADGSLVQRSASGDDTILYEENATGTLVTRRTPGGKSTTTEYSLAHYPLRKWIGNTLTQTWDWNDDGQLGGSTTGRTATSYTHDDHGFRDGSFFNTTDGGPGTAVAQVNDLLGRPRTLTDASGQREITWTGPYQSQVQWSGTDLGPPGSSFLGMKAVWTRDPDTGRLTAVTISNGPQEIHSVEFGYDAASGRLNSVSDGNGGGGTYTSLRPGGTAPLALARGSQISTIWQYDTNRRLHQISTTGAVPYAFTLEYNNRDLISGITRSQGPSWQYGYNRDQELISAESDQDFTYQYDAHGNRRSASIPLTVLGGSGGSNIRASVVYDTNRFHQYTAVGGAGTSPLPSHRIRITGEINRTVPSRLEIRADGDLLHTQNLPIAPQNLFEVELPLRNLSGQGRDVVLTITGRLPGAGERGTDAVSSAERIITIPALDALARGAVTDFEYDADGNLTADGNWLYTWNGRNQLVGMERAPTWAGAGQSAETLTFAYNAEGMRTFKEYRRTASDGAVTIRRHKFLYDGTTLLVEEISENDGTPWHRTYTWGLDLSGTIGGAGGTGGLLSIHDTRLNQTVFPVSNHRGDVVAVLAANGSTVAEWEIGPFGENVGATGNADWIAANRMGFGSKYTDPETGLVYFGYRYYDPRHGRWLGREPLGEEESFNPYAYCGNDPVNRVDLLGLESVELNGVKISSPSAHQMDIDNIVEQAMKNVRAANPALQLTADMGEGGDLLTAEVDRLARGRSDIYTSVVVEKARGPLGGQYWRIVSIGQGAGVDGTTELDIVKIRPGAKLQKGGKLPLGAIEQVGEITTSLSSLDKKWNLPRNARSGTKSQVIRLLQVIPAEKLSAFVPTIRPTANGWTTNTFKRMAPMLPEMDPRVARPSRTTPSGGGGTALTIGGIFTLVNIYAQQEAHAQSFREIGYNLYRTQQAGDTMGYAYNAALLGNLAEDLGADGASRPIFLALMSGSASIPAEWGDWKQPFPSAFDVWAGYTQADLDDPIAAAQSFREWTNGMR